MLSAFKEEVHQGQEDAVTKALRRARYEKPYQFCRKGNKEQTSFNVRVDEALSDAQLDLPRPGTSPALKRAYKSVKRGRHLIAERQKLIHIANHSELGWSMVAEYTADELADNSEDEKPLEKAERLAERKALKCRKKRVEPLSAKQSSRFTASVAEMTAGPSSYHVPLRWPTMPPPQLFRVPRPCLNLWRNGPHKVTLPKTAPSAAVDRRQWYPFSDVANDALGGVVESRCVER